MTKPNIVHEADAQRQHVRLQLPVGIIINDVTYSACDWSTGGVCVKLEGEEGKKLFQTMKQGQSFKAVLDFGFEGFALTLPVDMEIRYIDDRQQRVGCRFTNMSRRNISMLQYLVSAYVSGEIIQIGDLIDVAGRNNFTTARKIPSAADGATPWQRMRYRLSKASRTLLVIGGFGLVAMYFVTSLYERVYVVKPASAVVASEAYAVEAPSSGKVFLKEGLAIDDKIKSGELLYTLNTSSGNSVAVDSPCDCVVKQIYVDNNGMTSKGKPVLRLVPQESTPFVRAYVPYDKALMVKEGSKATLHFPAYGMTYGGMVVSVQAQSDHQGSSLMVIRPDEALDSKWVDDPVDVHIDTWLFQ